MKFNLSLSWRIYISMLSIILVSFIITGAATYYNFIEESESYHKERLSRKESAILTSINYYFYQEREGDFFPFYTKAFIDRINEFSDIHALTINLFDLNGILITSSDFIEYENSGMEKFVSKKVLDDLENGKESVLIDQMRGEEDHLAVYSYLRNLEGSPIAIINLPYFFSLEPSKQETYSFLKRLSLLYLIILVPALALGYYLTQYITKSLRKIGEKLKTIKINQKNEELQWEGKDEIGLLVSEYNKKVAELEESAKKLAQTERESAWREMAKQVAHEIKNPLTPMKLSVQQLERTWKDGGVDFDSRLERFAKTMTEQIDALTQIANEFSNFAKMPKTEITSVNIKDSILSVVDLFKKSQTEINFSINSEHENAFVSADKNEFIRVFNNLIKNAIQAIPKNQEGIIKIDILSENKNWKISITDNGVGIPKNSKNNLFVPNFTTKTTGMGLGLAMVKNIIDGIGGQIWFESEENKGTTFFILLNKA